MKQYHDLLKTIKEHGTYKEPAREGVPGTTSIFGYQFRHNLADGFPLLTTKKMFIRGLIAELLWFLQGDTNIKFLDEHNVTKMWHQDAYNYYRSNFEKRVIYGSEAEVRMKREEKPMSFEEFCKLIRETDRADLPTMPVEGGNYKFGDCGYQYGKQWRAWETGRMITTGHNGQHTMNEMEVVDQIRNVIKSLKSNPYGRRHLVTAIDPGHETQLALYWCHAMFQFNCRKASVQDILNWYRQNGDSLDPMDSESEFHTSVMSDLTWESFKNAPSNPPLYLLDCHLYQRSCDVFLGVPLNIASYAMLTHIIAKMCNMIPGDYIHTFGDVHIYDNHREAVDMQLQNDPEKYPLPKLELNPDLDWIGIGERCDFKALILDDIKVVGYESYPKIEAELSTGMKK